MEAIAEEADSLVKGQADIWKYMFSFVDSMALKCAVQLQLADIINSHGSPITLSQIVSSITHSTTPDISYLSRIMRLLVRRKIFAAHQPSDGGETLYGLTHSSRWLLRDSDLTLAPMVLAQLHHWLQSPWHCLSDCVKEGGIAFKKAHGRDVWEFASENHEFNQTLNSAMGSASLVVMKAVVSAYKDGFNSVESLVDVGGGIGSSVFEIVKSYPHIKAINFDLAHVVSTAPVYNGVTHVAGDMFESNSIPKADAIFLKWIMHDWGDKECVRILENCKKSIGERSGGKVVIVDIVVNEENGKGGFEETELHFDLLMIAHTNSGKERTENQWKKILEEGGFPRYKIIQIPALTSIIEAYPI